ncbi:MAG: hypothetical protein JNK79_12075 [Chitinophagaceae bacterium]|nr:hypothetical protein [Chitinophagaceae bacterium]
MKQLQLILLCVVFILHGRMHAQEPLSALTEKKLSKPFLFTSLPDRFEVALTELHQILSGNENEKILAQLSGQFVVEGSVVDKSQHTPGSVSVNVRLSNYQNALFNLTIRFLADNSTIIQGRVIHPRYGDVLELYKENGRYYMKKTLLRLYMPD